MSDEHDPAAHGAAPDATPTDDRERKGGVSFSDIGGAIVKGIQLLSKVVWEIAALVVVFSILIPVGWSMKGCAIDKIEKVRKETTNPPPPPVVATPVQVERVAAPVIPDVIRATTPATLTFGGYAWRIESNGHPIEITYSNGKKVIYKGEDTEPPQVFPEPPPGPQVFVFEVPGNPSGHAAFRIYPVRK